MNRLTIRHWERQKAVHSMASVCDCCLRDWQGRDFADPPESHHAKVRAYLRGDSTTAGVDLCDECARKKGLLW
jgi:hypothetical protein